MLYLKQTGVNTNDLMVLNRGRSLFEYIESELF